MPAYYEKNMTIGYIFYYILKKKCDSPARIGNTDQRRICGHSQAEEK